MNFLLEQEAIFLRHNLPYWQVSLLLLSMLKQLNHAFLFYSNFGVQQHFNAGKNKAIQLVNQLSLLVSLVCFIFIFQELDFESPQLRVLKFIIPFIFICIPILNKAGFQKQARFIFYLTLNAYCFTMSASFGFSSGNHLYFIPVIASTALVFNLRKLKYVFIVLISPVLSILLLLYLNDSLAVDQAFYRDELQQMGLQSFLITVIASFLLAFFYFRITNQQQLQLKQALEKQEELNLHLRTKEKKLQKNLHYADHLGERLRNQNEYYKSLFENASDITAVIDAEGYFKYLTPSFFRLTGFKPEEVAKKTVFEFVHPADLARISECFSTRLHELSNQSLLKFRYGKADGSYLYLEAKGTDLLQDPTVGGIVINSRDISDRLHYEEEAKTKERNIRSILDNNDNRIWLVDRNFILLDFNKAFASSFEEAFGQKLCRNENFFSLTPPEEHDTWRERFKAASGGEVHAYIDHYFVGEEQRTFRITIFPIMNEQEADRFTIFSKDITEQEKVAEALVEAREKAEEAARVKAQFLSTMSHEIRTPLNAIIGITHFLQEDDPSPEQAENLRILQFSAENLLVLLNDVLDLSKIEAGKVHFEHITFQLPQLVSDIKKSMEPIARKKSVALELLQDADLPQQVMGDPVRLSQVLTNLISNAIKFTDEGRVLVQLTVLEDSEEDSLIQFKVKDTGIGIPENMQEVIFESFTQGGSDTTRRFGGTGLGLAISKRLLELQGSKIALQSREGEGSTFSFTLHLEKYRNSTVMEENTEQGSEGKEALTGSKLLMVEDNPLNVFVGRKFLQKWGIELYSAENGLVALKMLQEEGTTFDLVLMDLQMPEMDGFETTRQIRQLKDKKLAELPVLAISAANEPVTQQKAVEAGMNGFVSKPFNADELEQKLRHYLSQKQTKV